MKETTFYLWLVTGAYFSLQAGLELRGVMGLLHGVAGRCDGFFSTLKPT